MRQSGVHGSDVCGCASGVKRNRARVSTQVSPKCGVRAPSDQIELRRHRPAQTPPHHVTGPTFADPRLFASLPREGVSGDMSGQNCEETVQSNRDAP
jgi:hypothetical protein